MTELLSPVYCFHGSPGVPEEFDLVAEKLKDVRVVPVQRGSFPLGERAFVLGYSWGSLLALREAALRAEWVQGIILVSPYLVALDPPGFLKKTLLRTPALGNLLLSRARGQVLERFLEKSSSPVPISKAYRECVEESFTVSVLRESVFEKQAGGLSAESALQKVKQAQIPVQVIWGDRDLTSDEKIQIQPIREILGGAFQEVKIPSAGHALIWTHAEEVARWVDQFCVSLIRRPYEQVGIFSGNLGKEQRL